MPQPPSGPTHPQPRVPFIFSSSASSDASTAAKVNPDERSSRALEYIAMYLDRIETHLAHIAGQLEAGNANGASVALAIQSLTGIVEKKTF
jgi:hypothetical protein